MPSRDRGRDDLIARVCWSLGGRGHIVRTFGPTAIAALPNARIGDGVRIRRRDGRTVAGSIATVERGRAAILPFGPLTGVAVGDPVEVAPEALGSILGFGLLGRAIDPAGAPLDDDRSIRGSRYRVGADPPKPSVRRPVSEIFETGIRALDGLLTIGRGARIGIFGGPGTGKTTLLESLADGVQAEAIVVALIGERGREARRWIDRLAPNVTVVCATADRTAPERIRAAEIGLAQAAYLRERGLHVLFVVDSLARYAAALRERANALGEPIGRGGFPASVWTEFNRYVESAGNGACGSVTLVASVLADADDERDPVCVAARAALDGHIVLSGSLARSGRFPAIDVLASASRTMEAIVDDGDRAAATAIREALALLAATEDARAVGLGGVEDPALRRALAAEPELNAFLRQGERVGLRTTRAALTALAKKLACDDGRQRV